MKNVVIGMKSTGVKSIQQMVNTRDIGDIQL